MSIGLPAEQKFIFHVDYASLGEIESIYFVVAAVSDISFVPRDLFFAFPNLKELEMATHVNELDPPAFTYAFNVTKLKLQDNNIKVVKAGVFTSQSNETSINADGLVPLHKLRELDLSSNKISEIEPNSFNGLNTLEKLSLENNELGEIRRESFAGLPSLIRLNLRNNEIKTIEEGALDFPALTYVDLSENSLTRLSDTMFDNLPKLQHISLDRNGMEHIGQSLYKSPSIEVIVLDWNHIQDIDLTAFAQLTRLQKLKLIHSGVTLATTKVDEAQQWNSSLIHLDLGANNLSDATELNKLKIFQNLEYLELDENALTNLEIGNNRTLKDVLPSLQSLSFTGNQFTCGTLFEIEKKYEALNVTVVNSRLSHINNLADAERECKTLLFVF